MLEQCYIALYDTTDPSKGYNISLGGESTNGLKHTEITKKRMSKSHKGKSHSKETKKKMSKNNAKYWKDKHLSEEHKKNLSKANKGKHLSEEAKQKLSENHKGKNNYNARSVICIATGRIFFTAKEGAEYYNMMNSSNILKCCKGKRNYCGKLSDGTKLVWRYVNYKHNRVYRVINR